MKSIHWVASLVVVVPWALTMVGQTYMPQDYPQTELSNGILRAKIYLPGREQGILSGYKVRLGGRDRQP